MECDYKYQPPENLTPLEAELEANAGNMEWYDEFSARQKDETGSVPEERCEEIKHAWANVIQKTFHDQIKPLIRMQEEHGRQLARISGETREAEFKRKEDRRRIDEHSQEIAFIKSGIANQSLKSDQVLEMVKITNNHISTISDNLGTLGDTVSNLVGSTLVKPVKASSAPPSVLSKVPIYAWVLIGAGAVGAIAFLATGDTSIFQALGKK